MNHYDHILLATDLSDGSTHTAEKAAELAKHFGATLSVIHAIEPIPAYGYPGITEMESPYIDHAKEELAKLVANYDVPAERQHVGLGSVKQQVLQQARKIGAGLIVIGSHGRHGLGALLGSNASALVHGAECDVFVVRSKD